MTLTRQCSRTACSRPAVATLTYVYADSTCVLGPLATYAEPHTYDLCAEHAARLTAPRGWDVVRLALDLTPQPAGDDISALADAVRTPLAADEPVSAPRSSVEDPAGLSTDNRRRHLRSIGGYGESQSDA